MGATGAETGAAELVEVDWATGAMAVGAALGSEAAVMGSVGLEAVEPALAALVMVMAAAKEALAGSAGCMRFGLWKIVASGYRLSNSRLRRKEQTRCTLAVGHMSCSIRLSEQSGWRGHFHRQARYAVAGPGNSNCKNLAVAKGAVVVMVTVATATATVAKAEACNEDRRCDRSWKSDSAPQT